MDNFDWEAPTIALIARSRKERQTILSFIRDLERLAYGLFILRTDINYRIHRYSRILTAIGDGADMNSAGSPLQLSRGEQYAIGQALDGPIYEMTRVRLPLLPQKPKAGSNWAKHFPNLEDRANWVHRLANLVLLSRSKNAQAGNYAFERKKSEYFARRGTSPFALTSQVLNEPVSTPEVLRTRQDHLLERLAEAWRLDTRPLTPGEELADLLD
jgi:Protein of unknown function (DUF1524)